jgi:hypothetical protein
VFKSALSAAFSRYADKVNPKSSKSQGEKKGETSTAMEAETENKRAASQLVVHRQSFIALNPSAIKPS